jgi:hypothetical protein
VKPADKNLGLAIVDRDWYKAQCLSLLAPPGYVHIGSRSSVEVAQLLSRFIQYRIEVVGLTCPAFLSQQAFRFLTDAVPSVSFRVPLFYGIVKVHKTPVALRPIASCVNYLTTPASTIIDVILGPVVRRLDSVLRDSGSLVCMIEDTHFPADSPLVLFTADVASLYPSIPNDVGLEAMSFFLTDHMHLDHPVASYIIDLMRFVLQCHVVEFDTEVYHQQGGTAMGTPAAVVYANIFMWYIIDRHIHAAFPHLLVYRRFIDDLWGAMTAESTGALAQWLNARHPAVHITLVEGRDAVFLDLHIYMGQRYWSDGRLDVEVYQKPLNLYLYVPFHSAHPRHIFPAVVRSLLMSYLRNSSDDASYLSICRKLAVRLRARGYPAAVIEKEFRRLPFSARGTILSRFRANAASVNPALALNLTQRARVPFVTQFAAALPALGLHHIRQHITAAV